MTLFTSGFANRKKMKMKMDHFFRSTTTRNTTSTSAKPTGSCPALVKMATVAALPVNSCSLKRLPPKRRLLQPPASCQLVFPIGKHRVTQINLLESQSGFSFPAIPTLGLRHKMGSGEWNIILQRCTKSRIFRQPRWPRFPTS